MSILEAIYGAFSTICVVFVLAALARILYSWLTGTLTGPHAECMCPFSATTAVSMASNEPVTIGIPSNDFIKARFISSNKVECSINAPPGYPTSMQSWPMGTDASAVPIKKSDRASVDNDILTVYLTTRARNSKIEVSPAIKVAPESTMPSLSDTVFLIFQPVDDAFTPKAYTQSVVAKAGWIQRTPPDVRDISSA